MYHSNLFCLFVNPINYHANIMKNVKLLFTAKETYIKTPFPAYYYGSPDNKVYVIYKSSYLTPSGKTSFEFIIARHEQFYYNYLEDKILEKYTNKTPFLNSYIDKPNLILSIVKNSKGCRSYENAEELLNILICKEMEKSK